jgi:hypothetical protein
MKSSSGLEKGHVIKLIGIFFPWIVVILGAMLLFSANAYNQTFGVFFKPITNNFGWTRATMSGAYAIRSLVCAVFVVPMGYWADRVWPSLGSAALFHLAGRRYDGHSQSYHHMAAISDTRSRYWHRYVRTVCVYNVNGS